MYLCNNIIVPVNNNLKLLFMMVFRINATCTSLELVHKTTVDNVPTAICGFQGRVIIGIGRILRLYDIGKKKLLRKCENKVNYTYLFFSLSKSNYCYNFSKYHY